MRHLTAFTILIMLGSLSANNIQMTSPALTGQNTASHTTLVQFNLSWENSWRDIVNWDAAWIFVKYKRNDGIWRHATLATTGHTAPSGATITTPSDGKGVFVYRSSEGSGTNNYTGMQLKWNYGSDGVGDNDLVTVKVFAIEMVYVPEGSFYVGDGSSLDRKFCGSDGTSPYLISSENAITLGGTSSSNLCSNRTEDDFNSSTTRALPAAFPKGFAAFYCMKYEVSQGQYADFLNTLTTTQADMRYCSETYYRGAISKSGSTYIAARPDRAYGYTSSTDMAAYADWAALRPMTELEYEKACRGDQYPVANEYAWGTNFISPALALSGTEDGTETVTTVGANCSANGATYSTGDGGSGPIRCGIFATATSNRESAGASYYGIMDMTGNVDERVVGLSSTTGREMTNENGDGNLLSDGNSGHSASWVAYESVVLRGGNFWSSLSTNYGKSLYVSYRDAVYRTREGLTGGRSVRTAPSLSLERSVPQKSNSVETK